MGHAPSIATKISCQIASETPSRRTSKDISPSRPKTRKNLFAHVIDALHHSRRLQAKQILRRYHHLIDRAGQGAVGEQGTACRGHPHVAE
jgi:hypothetical protein